MNEKDLSRVVEQPLSGSAELPQRPTEDVPPTAPDTSRVLIERWSYRAALCEKLHGNAELNRRERAELAGEARAYGMCANELRMATLQENK